MNTETYLTELVRHFLSRISKTKKIHRYSPSVKLLLETCKQSYANPNHIPYVVTDELVKAVAKEFGIPSKTTQNGDTLLAVSAQEVANFGKELARDSAVFCRHGFPPICFIPAENYARFEMVSVCQRCVKGLELPTQDEVDTYVKWLTGEDSSATRSCPGALIIAAKQLGAKVLLVQGGFCLRDLPPSGALTTAQSTNLNRSK